MCLLIYFNVCIKRLVVLLFVHPARNYRWSIYYYRARREILGHKKTSAPILTNPADEPIKPADTTKKEKHLIYL